MSTITVGGGEIIEQNRILACIGADSTSELGKRIRNGDILKMTSEEVSGDGYTSSIDRIVLELKDDSKFSFLLKLFSRLKLDDFVDTYFAEMNADQRVKWMHDLIALHDTECTFYELFDSRTCSVPGVNLPIPSVYGFERVESKPNGFLIMEDLCPSTHMWKIDVGLSEEQVRQVVDAIADFNAALIADRSENARWRRDIADARTNSCWSVEGAVESFINWLKIGYDNGFIIPLLRRFRKVANPEFAIFVNYITPKSLGVPLLVSHGDMWLNNLLWRRDDDKLAAIIDWQLCHQSNPMEDFARLLATSCSPVVRSSVESWLAAYYCERMIKQLTGKGINIDFTVKNLQRCYDFALVRQSLLSILTIEPIHRIFAKKSDDTEEVAQKTRQLVDRTTASLQQSMRFLAAEAPEWLDDVKNNNI